MSTVLLLFSVERITSSMITDTLSSYSDIQHMANIQQLSHQTSWLNWHNSHYVLWQNYTTVFELQVIWNECATLGHLLCFHKSLWNTAKWAQFCPNVRWQLSKGDPALRVVVSNVKLWTYMANARRWSYDGSMLRQGWLVTYARSVCMLCWSCYCVAYPTSHIGRGRP